MAGRRLDGAACPGLAMTTRTFVLMMIVGVVFFGIFTLVSGPLGRQMGPTQDADLGHPGHHRLRPGLGAHAGRRHCRRDGLADHRLHPHGHDLRPDGRAAARAVSGKRALHRLRHFVQRLLDPRRRGRPVHRGGAVERRRRQPVLGRRLPFGHGRAHPDRAAAWQGDQGRRHRGVALAGARCDAAGDIRRRSGTKGPASNPH